MLSHTDIAKLPGATCSSPENPPETGTPALLLLLPHVTIPPHSPPQGDVRQSHCPLSMPSVPEVISEVF